MACNNSPGASLVTTVPPRRKKAYSVSLQDKNLDISEVHISPDQEIVPNDDYNELSDAKSCPYCGKECVSKVESQNGNASYRKNMETQEGQLSTCLPGNVGRSLPVYDYLGVNFMFIYSFIYFKLKCWIWLSCCYNCYYLGNYRITIIFECWN